MINHLQLKTNKQEKTINKKEIIKFLKIRSKAKH